MTMSRVTRMSAVFVARLAAVAVASFGLMGALTGVATAQNGGEFTTEFRFEDCEFKARGDNPYFPLRPSRRVYEGEEDGELARVEITVLSDFEWISVPGLGAVKTRVVEERETLDGELVEISRNFFAVCKLRNDVAYFGEDVDIYNSDGSITHEGAWRAGQRDWKGVAEPGIIMPGTFLLGSRYFQELADGIALDRAEHVAMGLKVRTEAGRFRDCVKVLETTPLEPGEESVKIYCPGIGLVFDDGLRLIEYDLHNDDDDDDEDDDD